MLQDAGGLLDERPPILGPGAEHRVELALPDDDVQFTPYPAVAEQLLDVEQPARRPVHRVLALAAAIHEAADRHLGVVQWQRAV